MQLNLHNRLLASVTLITVALVISGLFPFSAHANVPVIKGRVVTETGAGVAYIHVKWQDASGGVRFAKTDSAGYYSFPSWSSYKEVNPTYISIPWESTESTVQLDEPFRLIDIWKTNNFVKEFQWYPARVVNGTSLPGSSWSCLSNPNKFSVVLASSHYDCSKIIVDPANRSSCDDVYPDSGAYHDSEVCELSAEEAIVNQDAERLLPNFICTSKQKISGSVMCRTAAGEMYPISDASIEIAKNDGNITIPVKNGAYSTDELASGITIASRLILPNAGLQVAVDGQPVTIQSRGTVLATNGCDTNFMNANCSGINPQRATQCTNQGNQPNSYEWCTLNAGSATKTGFDFVVNDCVLPVACGVGKITIIESPVNFKINPATGVYQPLTITWTQAVENPISTDQYQIEIFKGSAKDQGQLLFSGTSPRNDVIQSDGTYKFIFSAKQTQQFHNKLRSSNESKMLISVTPIELGGGTCPAYTGLLESDTYNPVTTTAVVVKIRDGECSGDKLPTIAGDLSAAWTGGTSGPTSNYDLPVTIPTGSQLRSSFTFASDLYSCVLTCPDVVSSATQKKCQKDGYVDDTLTSSLYISQLNITGWWESVGGLAYGQNIEATLPLDSSKKPLVCPETGPKATACTPLLMRSPLFVANLLAGIPIAYKIKVAPGWTTERPIVDTFASNVPDTFKQSLAKGDTAYHHFLSKIPEDTLTKTSLSNFNALSDLPSTGEKPKYFKVANNLTINPTSDPIVIPPAGKYIIFVEGTLTIGNDTFETDSLDQLIDVESGGFLAIIVSNAITIKPSVGTYIDPKITPSDELGIGTAPTANLSGIFITDDTLTIEGNKLDGFPDKRFIGEGSFVSATKIDLQREFNRNSLPNSKIISGYTPTEVFRHRPDIVLATPKELKEVTTQYQEVR